MVISVFCRNNFQYKKMKENYWLKPKKSAKIDYFKGFLHKYYLIFFILEGISAKNRDYQRKERKKWSILKKNNMSKDQDLAISYSFKVRAQFWGITCLGVVVGSERTEKFRRVGQRKTKNGYKKAKPTFFFLVVFRPC